MEIKPGNESDYTIKVLLIDDQAIICMAVEKFLKEEKDVRFFSSRDPMKGFEKALEIQPTVILQDLIMPEVDGLTMVKKFREHPQFKDVPLIVLSSNEEAKTKAEAFALGANDYIVKLPDRVELIARIRYHSQGYINLLKKNDAFNALFESREMLARELASAARYLTSLLPAKIPTGPIRADWRYFPSAQLGGDSLGYHWIDETHFAIYLLDVCGHGVGSALLSVTALNVLKTQILPNVDFRDPGQVLSGMNEAFPMENHDNLYFTLWYGVFNSTTRLLQHASGGHPPAILISAENPDPVELLSGNLIIGGMSGVKYSGKSERIPPGARLYVFSDGVYEVKNLQEKMWSVEDLGKYLVMQSSAADSEIDTLYKFLLDYQHAPILDDDFSMIRVDFD